MVGKVIYTWDGREMEATLGDDGRWTCPDPVVQDDLNTDLTCDDYSPADGRFGYRQLHEAARRLAGRVEAPEVEDGPPGMVY